MVEEWLVCHNVVINKVKCYFCVFSFKTIHAISNSNVEIKDETWGMYEKP